MRPSGIDPADRPAVEAMPKVELHNQLEGANARR